MSNLRRIVSTPPAGQQLSSISKTEGENNPKECSLSHRKCQTRRNQRKSSTFHYQKADIYSIKRKCQNEKAKRNRKKEMPKKREQKQLSNTKFQRYYPVKQSKTLNRIGACKIKVTNFRDWANILSLTSLNQHSTHNTVRSG